MNPIMRKYENLKPIDSAQPPEKQLAKKDPIDLK